MPMTFCFSHTSYLPRDFMLVLFVLVFQPVIFVASLLCFFSEALHLPWSCGNPPPLKIHQWLFFLTLKYASMYVHHVYAWCPEHSEEGVRLLRTGVMDDSEPPFECWKSSLGPLEEQQVLQTPEPSLWPNQWLLF